MDIKDGNYCEKGAYINFGFQDSEEMSFKNDNKQKFDEKHEQYLNAYQKWKEYQTSLLENHHHLMNLIRSHKNNLIELILKYEQRLQEYLQKKHESYITHVQNVLTTLETSINDLKNNIQTAFTVSNSKKNINMISYQDKEQHAESCKIENDTLKTEDIVLPNWEFLDFQIPSELTTIVQKSIGSIRTTNINCVAQIKLLSNAKLIRKFSAQTRNDKYAPMLCDMKLSSNGVLYILDKKNKALKKIDIHGNVKASSADKHHIDGVMNLCCLQDKDDLMGIDNNAHVMKRFDSDGNFISIFKNSIRYPSSISICHPGQYFVTDLATKSFMEIDAAGCILSQHSTHMRTPCYIDSGPMGKVVIIDRHSNTVQVLHTNGIRIWRFEGKGCGDYEFDHPNSACFDSFGNILVADTNNHRIQYFDQNGKFVKSILTKYDKILNPVSIQTDKSGNLFIAEQAGMIKVYKYIDKRISGYDPICMDTNFVAQSVISQSKNRNSLTLKIENDVHCDVCLNRSYTTPYLSDSTMNTSLLCS